MLMPGTSDARYDMEAQFTGDVHGCVSASTEEAVDALTS